MTTTKATSSGKTAYLRIAASVNLECIGSWFLYLLTAYSGEILSVLLVPP